jgi:hypothetical protein
VRYVQEEENQMRWEDAVHALYQLQNRMHLHTGGEEEESPERVGTVANMSGAMGLIPRRAKYIEGLENRLGRMENLLRLSGGFPNSMWRCTYPMRTT